MNNLALSIEHNGVTVRSSDDELLNLTDMWEACGRVEGNTPSDWLCSKDGKLALATACDMHGVHEFDLFCNQNGCMWAELQVATLYAKHLSRKLHQKCYDAVLSQMCDKIQAILQRTIGSELTMANVCSCGHSLDGRARFCPECGQRVREAA